MKKFSIVLGIVGLLLLFGGNFFYKNVDNAVDSGGSQSIVTYLNGAWAVKIPIFVGGVLVIIAMVFYYVYGVQKKKSTSDQVVR